MYSILAQKVKKTPKLCQEKIVRNEGNLEDKKNQLYEYTQK